ncbi:MAG TPA: hypothetical protein VFW80_10040 [Gaiellaceae bacterium]|nr:hypothetical protein [Gaiellaceae bacterium]
MKLRPPSLLAEAILWFGVLGAPLTWAGMHVVGVGVGTAACGPFGETHSVDPNVWGLAMTIAGGIVAVVALTAAIVMWVATRTDDSAPPLGRMHLLATIGLVLGVLFIFLILMAGLGATVTPECVQS